jgi:imidazole glycerol-phosphate synthase subunit HisF
MVRYQRRPRVIPCLLLRQTGLVKTRKFKDPVYLGDPRNVVKIFNDKEVDELVLLDINATAEAKPPQFELIREIVSECFAPLGYGGGISDVEHVRRILGIGVEKVVINTCTVTNPKLLEQAAHIAGSQSVVASIDVKKGLLGKFEVFTHGGRKPTQLDPVTVAKQAEQAGAGEILINSIDQDGMMSGYDLKLIRMVSDAIRIPVVACGGAGKIQDLVDAVQIGGASAAAAGSMFVFHGKLRGVLISFPTGEELDQAFRSKEFNQ